MNSTVEEITAEKLVHIVQLNQKEIIMNKIIEAAKNFKKEIYLRSDYKLLEDTIYYFKHRGFNVLIDYDTTFQPYKYAYTISWK